MLKRKDSLVALALLAICHNSFAEQDSKNTDKLNTLVVTAIQEQTAIKDRAESIGSIDEQDLEELNPTHAADALNRIPGVNIVQLGSSGQGAAAAIRQPISYGPVYLYLENGVPVRSSAFFNHNSIYETNLSEAHGAEIIKGPGSALYGSDAIGGVINIISNKPISSEKQRLTFELGEDQWKRLQYKSDNLIGEGSLSIRVGLIYNEGWRQNTGVDRQNLLANWQTSHQYFDAINTLFSYTKIDMDTGGSGLRYQDFINSREQAGNLIGFREVESFRLSSALQKNYANGVLTITPYLRTNDLAYIATWALNTGREVFIPWLNRTVLDSQDAHINRSGHNSLGALIRYRQDFSDGKGLWITGLDIDQSRGYSRQNYITRSDSDPGNYWLEYQEQELLYDFDVDFTSLSPYIHIESLLTEKLRLSLGLRYDYVNYDYDNKLSTVTSDSIHLRPADTKLSLNHLSPKLGLTYQISNKLNSYFSYRNAFRIPSAGQLFRSGKTENSTNLQPVIADSYEWGIRGNINPNLGFELALYYMEKDDDIVSLRGADGSRRNANVGKTEHKGIELGIDYQVSDEWLWGLSYTQSKHQFKRWKVSDSADFSGNDIPLAPEHYLNSRLAYSPIFLQGGRFELEATDQGSYYLDEANTLDYGGHTLLNFRVNYFVNEQVELYLNLLNVTDKLYAETASKWGPTYTPGRPRSAFVGLRFEF